MIEGITFEPPPTLFMITSVLVGIIIGWVIGFLDSNRRTSKKIEFAESKAELAVKEAERKVAEAQAQIPLVAQASEDDPGLLRLKNRDGIPALEMDGKPLNIKAVSVDQKRRLIELLTLIRPWVESGAPLQPVAKSSAPVNAPPKPAPVQSAVAASPSTPLKSAPPIKPAEEKNIRALSIVSQIDTVLQARLLDTPLATRGIRLTESSVGGVEVYVGLQKYPSLEDIPDAEIKTAIRAAISEWENKFTPGI